MGIKKRYIVVVVVVAYYYYQVRVAVSIASTCSVECKKGKNFASTLLPQHTLCVPGYSTWYAVLTYMLHVHIFIYLRS